MPTWVQIAISFTFTAFIALQIFLHFKQDEPGKMLTRIQITFALNFIIAAMVAQLYLLFRHQLSVPLIAIFQLMTAGWAALDSKKLGVRKYKSLISFQPFAVFVVCALLWIFYFPVYIVVRNRILSGNAQLKEEDLEQETKTETKTETETDTDTTKAPPSS